MGKQVWFQALQEPETTAQCKGKTQRPAVPTNNQYFVSQEKRLLGHVAFLQMKGAWPGMMTHQLHKSIKQSYHGFVKGWHFGFMPKFWLEPEFKPLANCDEGLLLPRGDANDMDVQEPFKSQVSQVRLG